MHQLSQPLTPSVRYLTIIESPFAGPTTNLQYARYCLRHSILMGETPFASHLLYTQHGVLNDALPDERALGMELGFRFYAFAVRCAVYDDLGVSPGMERGIDHATRLGVPVFYRSLYAAPSAVPSSSTTTTITPPKREPVTKEP